jgi:spermidine synthase
MPVSFALAAAGLTGFVALSYEIVWYRAFSFASGGASAAFPLVIAAYLVGIAEGQLIVHALRTRLENSGNAFRAITAFSVSVPVVCFLVVPVFARLVGFAVWGWGLVLVGGSTAALGALVPITRSLVLAPDENGTSSSMMYGANAIGAAIGALVTGYVLTRLVDTPAIATGLAVVGLVVAGITASAVLEGRERRLWEGGIVALALSTVLFGSVTHRGVYERLLYKNRYHGQGFERLIEGRQGIVALTADHHVFGGGIYDGTAKIDLDADQNHLIRALAIPAIHASPRRVLVVGLSTGAWAQTIANLPSVDEVTIVEANPAYRELLPLNPDVASLLHNSKVHIVVDDARRWLARNSNARFDVIVSNTTFNWRASTSRLLSVEFMQLVRDRLAPRGLFYFNTTDVPDAFWSAFDVFSYGLRFQNFAAVSMSPVGFDADWWRRALVQYRLNGVAPFDSATDLGRNRLARYLATPRDRAGWYGAPMLESRTAMLQRLHRGTPITDDNMGMEWRSVYPGVYVP